MREKPVPPPSELITRQEISKGVPLNQVYGHLGLPVVLLKKYANELLGENPKLAEWYACAGRNHETGNVDVSAS